MHAFPKVDWLRRNEHTDVRPERNHCVDLNAENTLSRVRSSTPVGMRTVAPAASGRASTPSSSLTCTNCGPSLETRRALRRHTLSNPRLTPLRRATSDMFTSGCVSSEGWHVQQGKGLPGQESEAP